MSFQDSNLVSRNIDAIGKSERFRWLKITLPIFKSGNWHNINSGKHSINPVKERIRHNGLIRNDYIAEDEIYLYLKLV